LTKRFESLRRLSAEKNRGEMRFKSGLSSAGRLMTFNSFEPREGKQSALRIAMEWNPDLGQGLLLYGPTGVGKSHLGCAITNRLIDEGVFTFFLPTVKIPKENTEAIERLTDPDEVPVLVLDDLGAEKGTDRALECLYYIIEGRLFNGCSLIVTTNFKPPTDLANRLSESKAGYGERLVSRLKQSCRFVPIGGRDMRAEEGTSGGSIRSGK